MAHWTTQDSSCGSGWLQSLFQDLDLSELEISELSITKTTQSSGMADTTWCSHPHSCTTESLLIILKSTTSSPLKCSRDIKLQERKFFQREKSTATSTEEPSTSPIPTMSTSNSQLMMTRSREWRTMENSEYLSLERWRRLKWALFNVQVDASGTNMHAYLI